MPGNTTDADAEANHGLLVEGGFLYDLALFNQCPSTGRRRGKRRNGNSRSRNHERMKSRGTAIGYLYPLQVIASVDGIENRNDFDAYLEHLDHGALSSSTTEEKDVESVSVDELFGQAHAVSDDDEKLYKLGGINLMVASMEYGMKKTGLGRNYKPTPAKCTLDKDPNSVPGRIRTVAGIPQFWPSDPYRKKRFWKIPWKKRKQRQKKRGGVNLWKINMKLEKMALDGPRDCSQSQLIGEDKASDFPICGSKAVKADKCSTKNESRKNKGGKVGSYASRPLSFIPSGTMEDELIELKSMNPKESDDMIKLECDVHGAFEMHTTGFGSKIMGKMGYVEGLGLGKECQGMAQPIQVVQRPKSLGLGAEVHQEHNRPQAHQEPYSSNLNSTT